MKTFVIKKEHLDKDNFYVGSEDLSNFDGNIESEENLRSVKFKGAIIAKGYIYFKAGSGIKAGLGITAGWGIKAGLGIKAGMGIKAGEGITAGLGITAGWGITAGEGIEAGEGIKAGLGIKAGWGIEAGWGITCKSTLSIGLRIFAGLCLWKNPTEDELKITCGKLEKGTICFGNLIETGIKEEVNEMTIEELEKLTGLTNIKIKK